MPTASPLDVGGLGTLIEHPLALNGSGSCWGIAAVNENPVLGFTVMPADIGTAALPLTVTFTDTVPEVTTVPAQLEAEFADDTVLLPSVNFQPE